MSFTRIRPQIRPKLASLPVSCRLPRPYHSVPILFLPIVRPYASTESLPRVAQPSFWKSMVPKFLRKSQNPASPTASKRSKEWNPATFFIVIYLFIGSNAIQMITLKNDLRNFCRKADAQIGLLQDVIGLVKKGKYVNVEAMLGTGDEEKEAEWEQVLREIEKEAPLWDSRSQRQGQRQTLSEKEEAPRKKEEPGSEVVAQDPRLQQEPAPTENETISHVDGNPVRGFY